MQQAIEICGLRSQLQVDNPAKLPYMRSITNSIKSMYGVGLSFDSVFSLEAPYIAGARPRCEELWAS